MGPLAWLKVVYENGQTISEIVKECFRESFSGMCKRPAHSETVSSTGD